MTAEIAILNRRAVALSADSAVTVSETGKIYNSADKIFELSTSQPIGLMVYNSLDYMGIPLDLIIKTFRDKASQQQYRHVFDAADAFFNFLRTEFPISIDAENYHVEDILYEVFQSLWTRFTNNTAARFADQMRVRTRKNQKSRTIRIGFEEIFIRSVEEEIGRITNLPMSECFYDTTDDDVSARYKNVIDELIEVALQQFPVNDSARGLLDSLAALILRRARFSSHHTGLVFAGLGADQLFPALIAYRFDGKILDRLKIQERDRVAIDNEYSRAKIIPFAQREMVDRFLFGIDRDHERAIIRSVEENVSDVGAAMLESATKNMAGERKAALKRALEIAVKTVIDDLRNKTISELKEGSESDSLDAVSVMSKPDLANFAEALVNITSVKRRASLETESVGGPIDVAVISRDDGFVWVKRKHYFDATLNPRFFYRKYGDRVPSGNLGEGGRHEEA